MDSEQPDIIALLHDGSLDGTQKLVARFAEIKSSGLFGTGKACDFLQSGAGLDVSYFIQHIQNAVNILQTLKPEGLQTPKVHDQRDSKSRLEVMDVFASNNQRQKSDELSPEQSKLADFWVFVSRGSSVNGISPLFFDPFAFEENEEQRQKQVALCEAMIELRPQLDAALPSPVVEMIMEQVFFSYAHDMDVRESLASACTPAEITMIFKARVDLLFNAVEKCGDDADLKYVLLQSVHDFLDAYQDAGANMFSLEEHRAALSNMGQICHGLSQGVSGGKAKFLDGCEAAFKERLGGMRNTRPSSHLSQDRG